MSCDGSHRAVRGSEDEQRRSRVAELEGADAVEEPTERPLEHRADPDPERSPLALLDLRRRADRDHDRPGREEPGDDREHDRRPDPHRSHERQGQERPADRAQVVHRPLEPVRAPVGLRRRNVCEQRAPRRPAQAPRHPARDPERPACQTAVASADRRGEDRCRGVPADGGRPAPLRIVRERASAKLCRSTEPVREPLDHPERRSGRAERARQEGGQQRGRDLVAEIGKQARSRRSRRRRGSARDDQRRPTVRATLVPRARTAPAFGLWPSTLPARRGAARTRRTRPTMQFARPIFFRATASLIPITRGTLHWTGGAGGVEASPAGR